MQCMWIFESFPHIIHLCLLCVFANKTRYMSYLLQVIWWHCFIAKLHYVPSPHSPLPTPHSPLPTSPSPPPLTFVRLCYQLGWMGERDISGRLHDIYYYATFDNAATYFVLLLWGHVCVLFLWGHRVYCFQARLVILRTRALILGQLNSF